MVKILIIEKNDARAKRISLAMKDLRYGSVCASSCDDALDLLDKGSVQLIIGNADSGALELTDALRQSGDTTPIIILTATAFRPEKRRIFSSGADGYLPFPLDLEELQMRVKSLLWRCKVVGDADLNIGQCRLHPESLSLETPSGTVQLRKMEYLLLEKLLSYPGRIFTRPQLMDELWGFESESDPRTVDTHIKRLRDKLQDVDDIKLQTVRGLGYRAVISRRTLFGKM